MTVQSNCEATLQKTKMLLCMALSGMILMAVLFVTGISSSANAPIQFIATLITIASIAFVGIVFFGAQAFWGKRLQ